MSVGDMLCFGHKSVKALLSAFSFLYTEAVSVGMGISQSCNQTSEFQHMCITFFPCNECNGLPLLQPVLLRYSVADLGIGEGGA